MSATHYDGWHFSTGVLAHGDGRPIVAGETHAVDGAIVACERGLHASAKALDALGYVSNPTHIARVRLSGDITVQGDKAVARTRVYLDVAELPTWFLHEFACRCAEAALMIANVDTGASWNAIHVKREWLAGRASDSERAAARAAAGDAARAAAGDAARDAAGDAAGDAAWDAAWDAARAAARDEINQLLEDMLMEVLA